MFDALQPEGCGFESTSRGYVCCLAAGGLWVRIHLKPPRRDPGQVLHSQLLMRFGVKLRFSVRSVEKLGAPRSRILEGALYKYLK